MIKHVQNDRKIELDKAREARLYLAGYTPNTDTGHKPGHRYSDNKTN